MISQPELGKRLADVRKAKGLTQEELVELCHVSVRTIQRIESGEVTPRLSTIKILLAALDQQPEDWQKNQEEDQINGKTNFFQKMLLLNLPTQEIKNTFTAAWIAGIIYMVLGAAEIAAEFMVLEHVSSKMQMIYAFIKIIAAFTFVVFHRGFISLAILFENSLLKQATYVLIFGVTALYITDIIFIYVFPYNDIVHEVYTIFSMLFVGAICLIFGVALIKLQDGMGQMAKISGILQIIIGLSFLCVVFFFIGIILLAPAYILQILLLSEAEKSVNDGTM